MLETSARLLRLLSLLQTHREWSGADLAERLSVTTRTVRRDIEKLRTLGYPVHATAGTAGGYRLGAGAALPPLLLDDDEAVAVAVGLRTAATGSVTGIEETSVRALAKLEQVLPARLRRRVVGLESMLVPLAGGGPTVDPEVLVTLAAACRDHHRLRFDYRDRADVASTRICEPHRLVASGRRWYLVAFDVERHDWRTYRVDRLTPILPTGPRFVPRTPPEGDAAAFVSKGVAFEVYPFRGRFVLEAPAEAVRERVPPDTGVVNALDGHRCELLTGARSMLALAAHVADMGIPFTVVDPPELVEYVRELGGRLVAAAPISG
ncbi:DNA-binding transcriptional regulator [Virgisporangium aliadipatigenens]|uniref:DNA-binding transcriptional regulator n=1 Tax=Virgisporangium aliadipatigenens TaxID=741659 RepID=A0A8J4DV23_9ACTN|nr:YafY family protein [Virgisporangium aliadipatigenens]GIJ50698.1 DNA-binding transcriptional regulator [Virgisporangium aliadipatigenens]